MLITLFAPIEDWIRINGHNLPYLASPKGEPQPTNSPVLNQLSQSGAVGQDEFRAGYFDQLFV